MNRNDVFGYFDNFIIKMEVNGKEIVNELITYNDGNMLFLNNNNLILSSVVID